MKELIKKDLAFVEIIIHPFVQNNLKFPQNIADAL